MVILAVLGFALAFVWQRAYTMSLSVRISHLENRLLELKAENSKKLIYIAHLSSPERIEALAEQMCQLRYSKPSERICVVPESRIKQEPQSNWKRSIFSIRDFVKEQWEKLVEAPSERRWRLQQSNL